MMKGSGLEEVLENIYGPNAVKHIISGKAYARALRAYFLVEGALVNKLIQQCVDQGLVEAGDKLSTTEIERIRDFYDGIAGKSVSVMHNDGSNELMKLHNCLL